MKGARGLYLLSMIVQTLVVFSTLFTTFLSKVLTDTLMASFNGEPLVADSLLEGWAINIITFGAGEEYLLNRLYILPIAILLSGLLSALLTCLRFFTRVKASATINKTSQMAVFSKITELPYAHFKKTKSGELLQTATRDLDVFRRFIMQDFGSINYTFWMVLICLSVLLSLNWKYTLISFSPFPIMFIYSFFLIKKVRSLYRETDDSEARMTDKIAENLNAVRIVKAYNAETYEIAEFEGKLKDYRKHFISWRKFSSFFFSSSDIFVFGADAISLIYGLALCFNGEIKPGTLVVAVSFVSMTVWPLRNVATILSNVGQVLASVDRINLILNAETEDRKSGLTPEIKGHIVFDHVSYHYEDEDIGVIKDVQAADARETMRNNARLMEPERAMVPHKKGDARDHCLEKMRKLFGREFTRSLETPEEYVYTYRCPKCMDTGIIAFEGADGYMYGRKCTCDYFDRQREEARARAGY